jgi:hypothetical protein
MQDGKFLRLITTLSESELQNYVNPVYDTFKAKHGKSVSFGPDGAKEFIASLFLAEHDTSTTRPIFESISKVFEGKFSPLDFSNQMDNIVAKSNIKYETWSSVWRFLNSNHPWINDHPCGSMLGLILNK